ncbi:MAG: tRNA (N(6)-L-threonylcarbamoyladenosine(37)-C(2))-methylthiotransferase MtaB [Filifactoraceae bacterium]
MEEINLSLSKDDFRNLYRRDKTLATYTLGCKVNQYETIALEEIFKDAGYKLTDFEKVADIYLVNTCTVTAMSERKCRQIIRRCKKINPYGRVVVVGCYSQKEPKKVIDIEGVNLVFGTNNRTDILREIESTSFNDKRIYVGNIMEIKRFEDLKVTSAGERARAYIKVQDGCDKYCSYCIIPYTRGRVRSRDLNVVVDEVETLVKNGYKEVVLTGIHIASYGKDMETFDVLDLIKKVGEISGLKRLRTSSMEPLIITDGFIEIIKSLKNFCPHFHLSLQSGSNSVLKRMNRVYTKEEYKIAVEKIREYFPDAAITTDIIVGFPGETDLEFEETKKFLEEIKLYEMHIFKYSQREGTPAASMKNQISAEIKQYRSNILMGMSKKYKEEFNKSMIGKTVSVLFEVFENGVNIGHTMNYINVNVLSVENLSRKILNVTIVEVTEDKVIGLLN